MPWVAGGTIVAGALGAVVNSGAIKNANELSQQTLAANREASDKALGLDAYVYDTTRSDFAPYLSAGYGSLNALTQRLGIPTGASATGSAAGGGGANPLTNPGGYSSAQQFVNGGTWAPYIQEDPGIAQQYGTMSQGWKDANNIHSLEDFAKWHWDTKGQTEQGRLNPITGIRVGQSTVDPQYAASFGQQSAPAPQAAPSPVAAAAPVDVPGTTTAAPTAAPANYIDPNGSLSNILTQVIAAAPVYTPRPAAAARQTVARTEMSPLQLGLDNYEQSPGYNFQLAEGNNNIIANAAATGLRRSGAAEKELLSYGQGLANQDYYGWADRERGQWNTDRGRLDSNYAFDATRSDNNYNYDNSRLDNNFNVDRAFTTDRYLQDRDYATGVFNTGTANLFTVAGMGQGANGTVANAGQNFASGGNNAYFSQAAATGQANTNAANAGIAGAANINGVINNGLNAFSYAYGQKYGTKG